MADTGILERIRRQWAKADEWPPSHVKKRWDEIEGYRERYENDRATLIQKNPNLAINNHMVETFVPVGWARELCRFSAALLFSDTPQVTLNGKATGPDLEALLRVNDFGATSIRAGIKTACEGRIALRIIRDTDIHPTSPLITIVPEDQVVWDIRHGSFYAGGMVIIERVRDKGTRQEKTYRLLEEHTRGLVTRTLYEGSTRSLGKPVPLKTVAEFAELVPVEETGLDRPTLVPWENIPGAESDLFGMGPLLDELNEAETLLLDRLRKSIPRVFVDRSLADETGRLEIDGYILTGGTRMRMPLGQTPSSTVEVATPGLLSAEHIAALDHIQQLMVTVAGYSPLTWGIQGQTASVTRAVSGYAMKLAQLRTLLTRSAKEHMALEALGHATAVALCWASKQHEVHDFLPKIELGDGLPDDPLDGAQEVLFLRQAMAASTETRVKTVHPTWTDAQVEAEADAITEAGMFPPGAGQGQGVGNLGKNVRDLLRASENDPRAGAGSDPAPDAS